MDQTYSYIVRVAFFVTFPELSCSCLPLACIFDVRQTHLSIIGTEGTPDERRKRGDGNWFVLIFLTIMASFLENKLVL